MGMWGQDGDRDTTDIGDGDEDMGTRGQGVGTGTWGAGGTGGGDRATRDVEDTGLGTQGHGDRGWGQGHGTEDTGDKGWGHGGRRSITGVLGAPAFPCPPLNVPCPQPRQRPASAGTGWGHPRTGTTVTPGTRRSPKVPRRWRQRWVTVLSLSPSPTLSPCVPIPALLPISVPFVLILIPSVPSLLLSPRPPFPPGLCGDTQG